MNTLTQLLSDCRQHLAADAYLADIPILIEGEGRSIAIATRMKANGLATLTFSASPKLKNLSRIRVEDVGDATYNVENAEIDVVNPTTIRYAITDQASEVPAAEATGIVTPLLIPIQESVEKNLASGGLLRGSTNKGGLAILLMIHRGNPADDDVPEAEHSQLRITIFCKPLLNASGLKKPPLDVQAALRSRMSTWDRGAGTKPPKFTGWNSSENTDGDTAWFNDFSVFHLYDTE